MFCTCVLLSIYNYSLHLWVKLNNISVTSCITSIEKEVLSGPFWFINIFDWFLILNLNLIEIEIHYIIELDLKLSVYLFEVFYNKVILFCERTINSKFAGTKICILFLMAPFDTLAIKAAKCNNVYDWLGGQLLCTKKYIQYPLWIRCFLWGHLGQYITNGQGPHHFPCWDLDVRKHMSQRAKSKEFWGVDAKKCI